MTVAGLDLQPVVAMEYLWELLRVGMMDLKMVDLLVHMMVKY